MRIKAHIFIAFGMLLIAIFTVRAFEALQKPGIGGQELYVVGGYILAACLIHKGWSLRRS